MNENFIIKHPKYGNIAVIFMGELFLNRKPDWAEEKEDESK